mmetsp:Transcript_55408/g.146084  ORF Transcript_55408/g.146084 Transcript_55408/m.146084 type:complete len:237 (-) Transcript_55408:2425-3135(-)
MPWNISHADVPTIRFTAIRHSLDFNEMRSPNSNQICVCLNLFDIDSFDQGHAIYCSHFLVPKSGQAVNETLPVISKEGPVDGLESFWCCRINRHIKLRDWMKGTDCFRKLRVGHEIRGDAVLVHHLDQPVYLRIHYRLPHERQCAMSHPLCLFQPLRDEPWYPGHGANRGIVSSEASVEDHLRRVERPLPLGTDRVAVMPPAKHALVGACQRWGGFHTSVACNAVESVLVTAPSPT